MSVISPTQFAMKYAIKKSGYQLILCIKSRHKG